MKNSISKCKLNLMIGVCVLLSLLGCESTYYKTMETMGYYKRDIMVDRVQDARDAQEEAKELLAFFREKRWPTFHIQHVAIGEDATFFLPDTKGMEIHDND